MIEQILFFAIAFLCGIYFTLVKRKFDYFSVAYFSSCIYFLPGFYGYTSYHIDGSWVVNSLNAHAYLIMTAVLFSIFSFAVVGRRVKNVIRINLQVPNVNLLVLFLFILSFIGLILLLITADDAIYSPDKNVVADNLGRWHILFYTAAVIGLPLAFLTKNIILSLLFVFLLIFDLYLGFRSAIAIGFLSVVVLHLVSKSSSRLLLNQFLPLLLVIPIAIFFFLYKTVAFSVRLGNWDVVIEALKNSETYEYMITRSEPFATQQILNSVISENFKVGLDNVLSAFGQLILFGPELGLSWISFNELFQPTLFPSVDYGLASNIWAQMWSAGGWSLLLIFLLFFNLVLIVGNSTLYSSSIFIKAGFSPIFLYWSFYIHRNDISYIVNIEKRIIIILFLCIGLAYLLKYLNRHHNKIF
jgi:hypothetical protein